MNQDNSTTADLILSSNALFSGRESNDKAGFVAISGNRILSTGSNRYIDRYIGPRTRLYRFANELIMPGFHDSHIHLFAGSVADHSVALHKCKSEDEAARKVQSFGKSRPADRWILGYNWNHNNWENKSFPSRHSLDRHIPNRPVFLFNAPYHGAWVNGKALRMCNVDRNTPDPPFGRIERDKAGEPTGFLYETAMALVGRDALDCPVKHRQSLLRDFLQKAARVGVTSVNNMLPLPGMELGDPEMYRSFEKDDLLSVRIHIEATLSSDLGHAETMSSRLRSEKLQFSGLKQFLDGVSTAHTAYMVDPYADNPCTHGTTLLPIQMVMDLVSEADRMGFRVRLHACGDGAVRLALDCFQAAMAANGRRDSRHTIEHVEIIHPDDVHRFKELGVIASLQPEHLCLTQKFSHQPFTSLHGKKREPYFFVNKTLMESGAVVAYGSDYPVVDLNPMNGIYRAVTRVYEDGQPRAGWNPQEKVSVSEALSNYTRGSAYCSFREDDMGTIEAGKLADIVVLDRNILETELDEIRETKVRLTVMDGKIVFEN